MALIHKGRKVRLICRGKHIGNLGERIARGAVIQGLSRIGGRLLADAQYEVAMIPKGKKELLGANAAVLRTGQQRDDGFLATDRRGCWRISLACRVFNLQDRLYACVRC